MKSVVRVAGLIAILLLFSMNAISAEKHLLTTQQAKDLLIDGNVAESLGQIDFAKDNWRLVIEHAALESPSRASALRKICIYDADFCENAREADLQRLRTTASLNPIEKLAVPNRPSPKIRKKNPQAIVKNKTRAKKR